MSLIVRAAPDFLTHGSTSPLFTVPGLSYLGCRRRKSPNNGEQWVLRFRSAASNDPTIASPAEAAYILISPEFEAEIEASGPTHELTVITPDDPSGGSDGVVSTTFELLGNALQRDLREHPRSLVLGPDKLEDINQVLDGRLEYGEANFQTSADGLLLYDLLRQRNGNGSYQVPQYVFRCSRIVTRRSTTQVGYSNVAKVFTTTQMLAETGPPTNILNTVVDAVTYSAPTTATSGYTYGWLKQSPTATLEAGNKVRLTSEWWLEQWNTEYMYALAS